MVPQSTQHAWTLLQARPVLARPAGQHRAGGGSPNGAEGAHDDLVLAVALACWYEMPMREPMDEGTAERLTGLATGEWRPWGGPGWGG